MEDTPNFGIFPTSFSNNNQQPQTKATDPRNNHFVCFSLHLSKNKQPPNKTPKQQPQSHQLDSQLLIFPKHFSNQTTAINSNKEPRNNYFAIFPNIFSTDQQHQQPKATI